MDRNLHYKLNPGKTLEMSGPMVFKVGEGEFVRFSYLEQSFLEQGVSWICPVGLTSLMSWQGGFLLKIERKKSNNRPLAKVGLFEAQGKK
jgi:hypothetical protein